MWRLYLKSDEGIAIQTSIKKLQDSIETNDDVFIEEVNYIDFESSDDGKQFQFEPRHKLFSYKRKSFKHENEVRAIIIRRSSIDHGLNVSVDLDEIIEKIYVGPGTGIWITDCLRDVIEKYGHRFKILNSSLDDRPFKEFVEDYL